MAEIISGALITSENDSTKTETKGIELVTKLVVKEFLGMDDNVDLCSLHNVPDEYACWVNFGIGGPA